MPVLTVINPRSPMTMHPPSIIHVCRDLQLVASVGNGKGPGCENESPLAGLILSKIFFPIFLPFLPYLLSKLLRTHIPAVPRLKIIR